MKTKVLKSIAVIMSLVITFSLNGCGGGLDLQEVTYAMSGTAQKATMTYVYYDGSIGQLTHSLPYTTGKLLFEDGDFLYVSAQNENASGTITVTINVNGKPWRQVTSSGAYVIATAKGTCC
jgi:archaellin